MPDSELECSVNKIASSKVKEVERLKEVEAAVNVQTMEFLEKKRNQLQDEVDTWEERQVTSTASSVACSISKRYFIFHGFHHEMPSTWSCFVNAVSEPFLFGAGASVVS